jgi:hypothetical protein
VVAGGEEVRGARRPRTGEQELGVVADVGADESAAAMRSMKSGEAAALRMRDERELGGHYISHGDGAVCEGERRLTELDDKVENFLLQV